MIKGFTEQTKPLSDYELNTLVPRIVRGLTKKVGKEKAITNTEIVAILKREGYSLSEARVRKIINYIRVNGIIERLIATSDGYYVANTKKEVADYIESLKGREDAIRAVRRRLEVQLVSMSDNYNPKLFETAI